MTTYVEHFGRRFAVLATFPSDDVKAANAFMAANPRAAVLTERNGVIYLADTQDVGDPLPCPTSTGLAVAGSEVLAFHVTEDGRAFLLEPDGTTICEIVAPAHNKPGALVCDLVHGQLSAVKLLAALKGLMSSLSEQDDEGMLEHAEPMVYARKAVAFAEGRV